MESGTLRILPQEHFNCITIPPRRKPCPAWASCLFYAQGAKRVKRLGVLRRLQDRTHGGRVIDEKGVSGDNGGNPARMGAMETTAE